MYDNIYPTRLNGSDIDGQEISLNVCPGENFRDEVSTFFPPSEVKSIINVYTSNICFQPVGLPLEPCFLFLSSRGFDRIKVILRWILGSNIEFPGRNLFCGYVGVLNEYIKRE